MTDKADKSIGRWRWLSVFGLFIATFFVRGSLVSLGILFVALNDYFDEGAGTTSWVISISPALCLIIGPISSAFAKRYGCRKVVMTGGVLSFLSILISSFATNIWQLVVTIGIINGLAVGLVYSPSVVYTGLLFERRLPLANGIGYTGIGIGSVLLPIVFQSCLDHYGWRGTLMVYSAMTANFCVCAAIMIPIPSKSQPIEKDSVNNSKGENEVDSSNVLLQNLEPEKDDIDDMPADTNVSKRVCLGNHSCLCCKKFVKFFDCHAIFTNCRYNIFSACFFLMSASLAIAIIHLAPLLLETGLSPHTNAVVLSFFGIGTTVGGPFFGFVATHFQVNIAIYIGCGYILFGSTVLAACTVATNFVSGAIIVFLMGFIRGMFASQHSVVTKTILGDEAFSIGFGILLCYGGIAQLIGPPISGYLRDYTGTYKLSILLAGLAIIFSGSVVTLSELFHIKCRKRQSQPAQQPL